MKTKLKLDRIYLKILSVLQSHARITNQQLADRVGLSPSPCLERVKRLEQEGFIKGYLGRIDLDRISANVMVYTTVALRTHEQGDFLRFEEAVRGMPEVVECYKVSGEFDYILRFVCADMARYNAISDALLRVGHGVDKMSSHVVFDRTKEFMGYPLERLAE